jgi:hypothetical protein
LRNGWKDIDYLLVNDVMVQNFDGLTKLPQLTDAYKHSYVLEEWGSGQTRVQLRKLDKRMVPFGSVGEAAEARPGVPPVIAPEPGSEQPTPPKIVNTFGSGQWTVGKDITPGTYRSVSRSRRCYWAKISDVVKETKSKSQYGRVGQLTVKITARDEAFLTTRCGTWTKVSP